TPDIGADEFSAASGDLDLVDAAFMKDFPCLSTSDTIAVYIQNIIGSTVDFAMDSLVINYDVTGPVNTAGSYTVNSGTLAPLDTAEVIISGIDLSLPGVYTLEAWINP